MAVHNTSYVSEKAIIGQNVKIGPFCVIGDNVEIGDNVIIQSHVSIQCRTKIGSGTKIYPFVSIDNPQDLKYGGEDSEVIIGSNCVIREYATINSGTKSDNMQTIIGDNCLLMIGVHIAHDCVLGNNIIMANNATLGGHTVLEDNVIIGGLSAVHQHTRIGRGAIVGGMTGVAEDVIPYGNVICQRAFLDGINLIGLKRSGVDKKTILEISKFIENVFLKSDNMLFEEKLQEAARIYTHNPYIMEIIEFSSSQSRRSLCMPIKNKNNQ